MNQIVESKASDTEKGEVVVLNSIVETFLSFDDVLQNSNEKQQDELIRLSNSLLRYKNNNKNNLSNYSQISSAYLLGRLLQTSQRSISISDDIESFLKKGNMVNEKIIFELLETYKSITQ